jgi:dUTP pyrophosphatase|tara:strand:- start:55 stop:510 length:456 start_codon:yes stop_codon:yes gene_type:complete
MILEYAKVRQSAISPERANPSDAGLDVFFSPETVISVVLNPGDSKILPTGLKFGVPHGYMLEVKNRSSVAAKRSLVVGACIVDSGYAGEVFINLHNVGTKLQVLSAGDKIAQLVMTPVVHFRPLETTEDTLYSYPMTISNRGTGALGSTDE